MTINRRHFLLSTAGASVGAIVPAYYFRALQFFEQFNQPLLEPPARPTKELFAFPHADVFELSLGNPEEGPPNLTFREYFTRYEPEGLATFAQNDGMRPEDLDDLMIDHGEDYLFDRWYLRGGPCARASHYLQSLDLGPGLVGPATVGVLDFYEHASMTSSWRGVRYEGEITLSLLQQRLNDLGTGVQIITGRYAF